jgi:membrane dipeptidase
MRLLPAYLWAALLATPTVAETPEARAARILSQTPVADGHNDWPYALRLANGPQGALTASLDEPAGGARGHTSIPLLRQGRVGIQLWSTYVPATLSPADAVSQTFEQIAIAKSFATRRPETFATVTTAAEAQAALASGRIAGILALEGAHQVADDIETLRKAHMAGVRSMTLSHSRPTQLFDSATADPKHNGIASGAPAMIAEMNRLGILVDLSHVSPAVMHAVLDITKAPVLFSHSSAKAVTNHPRNVPDDVLKRLKQNGGLVMVTFVPAFIDQARADWQTRRDAHRLLSGPNPEPALAKWDAANPRPVSTLSQVADHVDHVARVAGHDHVGLGGDYDGVPDLPRGLENVGTYPALFAELAARGWSDRNLRKLANENFLRVLKANEAVARSMANAAATR